MNNGDNSKARVLFGALVSFMFVGVVTALLFLPIPDANRSAVDILLGSLAATMGAVYNFYFGSSEGSKNKTDVLGSALKDAQQSIQDTLPPYNSEEDYEEVKTLHEIHPLKPLNNETNSGEQ